MLVHAGTACRLTFTLSRNKQVKRMNERRRDLHKQAPLHAWNTKCGYRKQSRHTDPLEAESFKVNVHQDNLRRVGAKKSESAELSNMVSHWPPNKFHVELIGYLLFSVLYVLVLFFFNVPSVDQLISSKVKQNELRDNTVHCGPFKRSSQP